MQIHRMGEKETETEGKNRGNKRERKAKEVKYS